MEDVAVIGAGPYGLSTAAHLASAGIGFRIFGKPMQTWAERMPEGMHLKSEGFATSLYGARNEMALSGYCAEQGIDYADIGTPVARRTFVDYGRAFQRRLVPTLEQRTVTALRSSGHGFELELDDGEVARFRRVVVAAGISHFAHVPPSLGDLPGALVSHSSARSDYREFAGKRVAVLGGGASAIDCAVELAAIGADVSVIARRALRFHNPPRRRTLYDRMRAPFTEIGSGWKSVALTRGPLLFHAMPQSVRHDVTRRYLGPASCWFTRDTVENHVRVHSEVDAIDLSERGGRIALHFEAHGARSRTEADHVIAATGYRIDLARLPFLAPDLRMRIAREGGTPTLTREFQTSVPGLYFVGAASANAFGPLVRFACGARFTARRLTGHLSRTAATRTRLTNAA